jgi:hypothetical protein
LILQPWRPTISATCSELGTGTLSVTFWLGATLSPRMIIISSMVWPLALLLGWGLEGGGGVRLAEV